MSKMMSCRHIQSQLSAYLDGELNQQARQRIAVHLDSCEQCKGILHDFSEIQKQTGGLHYQASEEDLVDKVLQDQPAKGLATIGWIALIVGYCGFLAWQLFHFYTEPDIPTWAKIGVGILEAGFLALLISVARQRFVESKTDKYKDVKF